MREVKFRGKRIDNNEWVYGDLIQGVPIIGKHNSFILPKEDSFVSKDDFIRVNQESVSQFTGLKDKNGKEIYEGDILHWVVVGEEGGNIEDIGIKRDMGKHEVVFEEGKFSTLTPKISIGHFKVDEIEVIGNIHEDHSVSGEKDK